MAFRKRKIGHLTVSMFERGPKYLHAASVYFDWRPFTDPRHQRIVIGRHVWRPLGERYGWREGPRHEWRIWRYEVLHYGPVDLARSVTGQREWWANRHAGVDS